MNKFIPLKVATKISDASNENISYSSSSEEHQVNTQHILKIWHEIYPNNRENSDRSVLLVEDTSGNVYVAKEQNDCCICNIDEIEFIVNTINTK